MSDLDADLYGDLYANEENEFAVPIHDPEHQVKTESHEPPKEEAKPAIKQEPAPPVQAKPPAPSPLEDVKPHVSPSDPSGASAIPSYTSPPTQQIATYEDRTNEYREAATPRHDSYQGTPGVDRPVRPSEMKEEGKMFIGGLNWDTTDESLRKYFTQFGKVEACTIMRDAAGRSRCFAFLTFEDPASVNAVMVREHFLDGKIIDPKRAIPRQEHQRATKLFIGGLPGSVTSESMREFFAQFGKVVDATVMLDRETGRSKGFGFVSFENVNVEPMLGFGNLQIDGKLIDVKLAQPRSQREGYAENGGAQASGRTQYAPATGAGAYGTQNYSGQGVSGQAQAAAQGGAQGNGASFDPQALAQLYTRMISQIGGMNPAAMMGGMNPAMMGGQYGGQGMGGMGMRGGPMMGGPGMGGMGMGRGGGMGGGMGMQNGPGSLGPNVPRGPRNAPTGPSGGVGPQRAGQRGQHSYHPYAR
ncbi:hypothetical protein V8D89_005743 [Ganoderma adspersum]